VETRVESWIIWEDFWEDFKRPRRKPWLYRTFKSCELSQSLTTPPLLPKSNGLTIPVHGYPEHPYFCDSNLPSAVEVETINKLNSPEGTSGDDFKEVINSHDSGCSGLWMINIRSLYSGISPSTRSGQHFFKDKG